MNLFIRALGMFVIIAAPGHAADFSEFSIGGLNWKIPSIDINNRLPSLGTAHTVTLELALPGFSAVDPAAYKAIPTDVSSQILSLTLSDSSTKLVGQALLDSLGFEQVVDCSDCSDSSFGGKIYSNKFRNPKFALKDDETGLPYNLYVNKIPDGYWFAVCRFRTDRSPMPCEVREVFGKVFLTYTFPPEYLSRALWIDKKIHSFLAEHQVPQGSAPVQDIAGPPPPCWSPAPGSPGAELLPLQVGPELWHIPEAYAATFGSNQTKNPKAQGFSIYLKLPDLEPLGPEDRSPFMNIGYGPYIDIFFTHDTKDYVLPSDFLKHDDGTYELKYASPTYIGPNKFIDYEGWFSNTLSKDLYISNDSLTSKTSFPPQEFDCSLFGAAQNGGCKFTVRKQKKEKDGDADLSQYTVAYFFSREYFSDLVAINKCVGRLYDSFSSQQD